MQHFRSVHDVADLPALLERAQLFKAEPRRSEGLGRGKTLGLVFLNPSTRTRLSSQLAARNLGLDVMVFNAGSEGWTLEFGDGDVVMDGTTVEHVREAARVLGRYFDLLGVRTFPALRDRAEDASEHVFNQFVQHAGKPVISLESATLHPLQSLADVLTIREHWRERRRPRVVLTWAPHIKPLPHCVANSFAQWINHWGDADFVVTHPEGYALDPAYTAGATVTTDQHAALAGADFVYVKNWSATQPYGALRCDDRSWMPTAEKLAVTNDAYVMHCLPVRRNLELGSDLLDGPRSLVTEQAANRVWACQAVLAELLESRK